MSEITIEQINDRPCDDQVHVLERINDTAFFAAWNNKVIFAVQTVPKPYLKRSTELLELNQGVQLADTDDSKPALCDFIIMKNIPSQKELDTFIRLCIFFTKHENESLESFFETLVKLFRVSDGKMLDVIGLFGELAVAKQFLECNKINPEQYWQLEGLNSKYDFTFPNVNVEVKTSTESPFIAKIKHKQLFNEDKVFLATCALEKNSSGQTILDLIEDLRVNFHALNELHASIMLEERLLRIPSDEQKLRFSTVGIKLFDTKKINPFPNVPERIDNLNYHLNISDLPIEDFESLTL